ncbi:hypothetical protein HD806DRAFT_528288 [Xylariaceae sp. AK1471]|nr:hypothetical protein HD806DRAFT_528288 [Xylariaceae sp. AK1471]
MTESFKREDRTPEPCTSDEMVTLTPPSGRRFLIHARPLAHLSRYFRTALNSQFREAKDRTFSLTEHCDDEVLEIFTKWTYLRSSAVEYSIGGGGFMEDKSQHIAVKAWLFGDYMGAPDFQNDMMRYLVYGDKLCFEYEIFQELGPHIPKGCRLEKFLVDMFCFLMVQARIEDPDTMMRWLPQRLVEEVFQKLVRNALVVVSKGDWAVGKVGRYMAPK